MTRVFDYHWLRHTSMALVASLLWVGVSSVEASIILPEESQLGGEWLFAGFEASSGSSSSAPKPDEQPLDEDRQPDDPDPRDDGLFTPFQSDSGGTTTGTSSVATGASPTGSFVVNSTAHVPCADTDMSTRVSGEQSFTLPIPPDNELLRPPQVL
jgi:hypothetical protein